MVQKKQTNKLIYLVLCVVFLLVILFVLKNIKRNEVGLDLRGTSSSLSKQSQFTVDVFLNETKGQEVTAYDIQLDYDKTKAKLISADPGGYLTNPLIIKWDVGSAWFAASANPGSYKDSLTRTNPDKPALTLTFMALEDTSSSTIRVKDTSEVYVAQKGGMTPSKAQFHFSVKN